MPRVTMKLTDLAQQAAQTIIGNYPELFEARPVRASKVAEALGMKVQLVRDLSQRARLDCFDDGKVRSVTVRVRSDLNHNVARFALAHEIGHYVLLREHSDFASSLGLNDRELFSNQFAAELLIPSSCQESLAISLRDNPNLREVLELASEFGVSPATFLFSVSRRNLLHDMDVFYLLVKHLPNKHTGAEPRLRIESAHYDSNRYFVPSNRSILNFACEQVVDWLKTLPIGVEASIASSVRYSVRSKHTEKFKERRSQCSLDALRLKPSSHDGAAFYLLVVRLLHSSIPSTLEFKTHSM